MAAVYNVVSPGQNYLNVSHSNTARSPSSMRRRVADNGSSIEDRLQQFPVHYRSGDLHNGTTRLVEQSASDFVAADMIMPRYMRQTIGSLQKAWINRRVVSGRPARTKDCFTYEAGDANQLEYGQSKDSAVNNLQLKPTEDVDASSGLPVTQMTTFLHKGYGSLRSLDQTMYSLDAEDQALTMQTSSGSRVQYNTLRQPHRPIGVINRHEPTRRKATPLLGSRCHGQPVLENSTELPSFVGIFPLSAITYKLNSREIKSQKPTKQPLAAPLESELEPQFNLRPITCNSAKSLTWNRNNAQYHGNHDSRNSLNTLQLKGNFDFDEAEVETKLFHVKLRTSRDDTTALGKLSRHQNQCSTQTTRCAHAHDQQRTTMRRPGTSTLTRATLYKRNVSAQTCRHNSAVINRKVNESQEIHHHWKEDKPDTEGTQLEHAATNSDERLADSIFPKSSAAVDILQNHQSAVSIAPPLSPSPAATAVKTLAASSGALLHPYHSIKSALLISSNVRPSSTQLVAGDADRLRDRSALGRKGKVENENTTWLGVSRPSKSAKQRRKVKPIPVAPVAKRFSSGAKGQSAAAAAAVSEKDELSSEKSDDGCSSERILRQTVLEKREEIKSAAAAAAAENSEEETQERNERICEWLLGLNYSHEEPPPPSPVIIEEMPMQTDTAIHIVYNGD